MQPADFVGSYFDAWNRRDPQQVANHLTKDGIYCDIPAQSQHVWPELASHLAKVFATDDCRYELEGEILTSRNAIAFQYSAYADCGDPCWRGAEFLTMRGRQAIQIRDYYSESLPPAQAGNQQTRKYAKSGLDANAMSQYKDRLSKLMARERVYLRDDLTLPMLSRMARCPVNHLSQVINAGFGVSFFDFLNGYRIEEAKRLLRQPDRRGNSVLDVAFAAGFNSTSTFYTAFKKANGQTPAEYRRAQQATRQQAAG